MSALWWMLVGGLLVGVVGVVMWRVTHRHPDRADDTGLLEARLRVLQDDVAALCACQADTMERIQAREQSLRVVEGRLEAVEQRLRQIARRQEEQLHAGEPGETSYGAAIRLAHQGANVEQLVNTFGLARGEAELIAALHRAENET